VVDENLLVGVRKILVTKFDRVPKSRTMRWTGHVARMEALVEQHEGTRPLGRSWLLWACNINHLNADLKPICHLLALLGAHPILHISSIRVKGAERNRVGGH